MKKLARIYWQAALMFDHKSGFTLAAACSFYIVLSIIPFLLLVIRIAGTYLGEVEEVQQIVLIMGKKLFITSAPEVAQDVRKVLTGPLFASAKFTIINAVVFTWSSLSLLTSVWNGLYLMTGDRTHYKWKKHFKGLFLLGITLLLMVMAWFIPSLMHSVIEFVKSSELVKYFYENIPVMRPGIDRVASIDFGHGFLFKSTLLSSFIFLSYLVFLFKWFFGRRISIKTAFLGAFTFVVFLIVGRSFYWLYLDYVRDNMIRNYGDYYTFIIGIVWIFLVMCFFFYAAAVCQVVRLGIKFKKPENWVISRFQGSKEESDEEIPEPKPEEEN